MRSLLQRFVSWTFGLTHTEIIVKDRITFVENDRVVYRGSRGGMPPKVRERFERFEKEVEEMREQFNKEWKEAMREE